ncbi:hypothetical protein J6590_033935 [Homalodisca vitripennis]|nr:hypothetical protein J6590_033935 [Homalodisca vitripennis]
MSELREKGVNVAIRLETVKNGHANLMNTGSVKDIRSGHQLQHWRKMWYRSGNFYSQPKKSTRQAACESGLTGHKMLRLYVWPTVSQWVIIYDHIFMQDGAPPCLAIIIPEWLDRTFPGRWQGRRGRPSGLQEIQILLLVFLCGCGRSQVGLRQRVYGRGAMTVIPGQVAVGCAVLVYLVWHRWSIVRGRPAGDFTSRTRTCWLGHAPHSHLSLISHYISSDAGLPPPTGSGIHQMNSFSCLCHPCVVCTVTLCTVPSM